MPVSKLGVICLQGAKVGGQLAVFQQHNLGLVREPGVRGSLAF
jgi:hypothetical protein